MSPFSEPRRGPRIMWDERGINVDFENAGKDVKNTFLSWGEIDRMRSEAMEKGPQEGLDLGFGGFNQAMRNLIVE